MRWAWLNMKVGSLTYSNLVFKSYIVHIILEIKKLPWVENLYWTLCMLALINLQIGCPTFWRRCWGGLILNTIIVASCNCFYLVSFIFCCNDLGCMNTRRVNHDHLSTPKTPQNNNSAGDWVAVEVHNWVEGHSLTILLTELIHPPGLAIKKLLSE